VFHIKGKTYAEQKGAGKVSGPKGEEAKNKYNVKIHDFNSSADAIRVIKYGRMRWMGHAPYTERRDTHTGFWWRDLHKRNACKI
jgi:hypothetical protein